MRKTALISLALSILLVAAATASAAVIRGNNGKNTLKGTALNDYIDGKGGPDRLFGKGGNDDLYGHNGDDYISGGFGNDRIWTSSGADRSYGGPGDDLIIDDYGHDRAYGGDGNDRISGGSAPDDLFGGRGDDLVSGGTGNDPIDGGEGNDVLLGEQGRDRIIGGLGDDTVYANDGGWDRSIDCGDGVDIVYIDPLSTDAGAHDEKYIGDRYVNCEQFIEREPFVDPSAGIAWASPDDYSPSFGQGTDLNDRMLGHHGSDRINGEGGNDVLWADSLPRGDAARILAQVDVVYAGYGDDTVYASPGNTTIYGEEGNDYLQGNVGSGLINAGNGDDRIKLRSGGRYSVAAGDGNDRIIAIITTGFATINCGPGLDIVELPASTVAQKLVKMRRNCERKKLDGASRTTSIRH